MADLNTPSTVRIKQLDSQLADQIAAGEVVERPAAVVKELMENAIDAGSQAVRVDIRQGGIELIKVTDDGEGIQQQELSLALSRHATSKIDSFSDLMAVATLGFRGEALASIAAVSRLTLTSCFVEEDHAWQISSRSNGELTNVQPAAHPQGTTVEVRDLFYNTPARRKFLKSLNTEYQHIEKVFVRMALAHFNQGLTLFNNGKLVLQCRPATTAKEQEYRLIDLLGGEFVKNAARFDFAAAGVRCWGWAAKPTYNRGQADRQFCYINGRYVRDKVIMNAVKQAYHDVMFHGRFPAYVLYLEIDPKLVDVNVHPTKHEVRFRDSRSVHQLVRQSLQEVIAFKPNSELAKAESVQSDDVSSAPVYQSDAMAMPKFNITEQVSLLQPMPRMPQAPSFIEVEEPHSNVSGNKEQYQQHELGTAICQLHNIYILSQNENGLVMVDMHAAHERILYEKLKQQYHVGSIPKQQLLVPLALDLDRQEMHCFQEYQADFEQLGLEMNTVSETQVLVRSVPVLIKQAKLAALIHDTLGDLQNEQNNTRIEHHVMHVLATVACRAAVWAHHQLSLPEMDGLLRQLEQTPRGGQCNHGRPTIAKLSLKELDALFLRGQ